jgi:predicted nuclease of predicted toxin-antitoxin system
MKLLIDINLSPDWIDTFEQHGWRTAHWSKVGDIRATDKTIMEWARQNDYVVFTHDLDFGTLLAITHAKGPSVIQIRTQDIMPQRSGTRLVQILRKYEPELKKGSLITIDEMRDRVKILPF